MHVLTGHNRRREAANLARALELSTQQAKVFANTSPHFFSSSDHATEDSREMELRPVEHAAIQSSPRASLSGRQPAESAEQKMGPPSVVANTAESLDEDISSFGVKPTSPSDIQSVTPIVNPKTSILVPESVSNNTSGSSSHKSYPPSSFPAHLLNPSPNPVNSSSFQPKADIVCDSLGLSSNGTSHTSSIRGAESSSNQPSGVSPTLLSSAAPDSSIPPPAKKIKQYGKAAKLTPSSPLKRAVGPTVPGSSLSGRKEKRRINFSSDGEDDTTADNGGKSAASVAVGPSPPKSPRKGDVPISPDPLDSIRKGKATGTPAGPVFVIEIPLSARRLNANETGEKEKGENERSEKDKVLKVPRRNLEQENLEGAEVSEEPALVLAPTGPQNKKSDTPIIVEASTSTTSLPISLSNSLSSITDSEPPTKPKPRKRKYDPLDIPDVDDGEDEDFQPGKKAKPKVKAKPKAKAAPKEKKEKKPPTGKKGKQLLGAALIVDDEGDGRVVPQPPAEEVLAPTIAAPDAPGTEGRASLRESEQPPEPPAAPPSPIRGSAAETELGRPPVPSRPSPSLGAKESLPAKQSETVKQSKTAKASTKKKGKAPAAPLPSPPPEVQPDKENTPSPAKSKSPTPPTIAKPPTGRALQKTPSNTNMRVSTPMSGASRSSSVGQESTPGPGGMKWKTSRNDLSSVLAKFGGHRRTGMSNKLNIVPLHAKIGTPAKALPPVPKKPHKKVESDEDDDDDDGEKKVKPGSKEWLMMED
ncbi:hypothetical protein L198_03248 [Cryptococcus wingfieldii CBS 7118]|uniref:Uncharacterized protein n=1 Tax=Cryptococcus wingfieldii CBS 7118 TaxID=1295528 RepID=A0A1E3JH17_9TREE|nr:hypothetical protein L198_03248 [Cryptococcus wingfieldii CBS 7118]ODN99406.1 hypothetical protein L198_03248 [Cryptococcus wingfieldii CBS 7118]